MRINQMWPSRTLDAHDLAAFCPGGCVVTIEAVDYKLFNNDGGEPEPVWFMYTAQFKKPFRLNKSNAMTIADQLGSDETDDWRGKHIRIRPFPKMVVDRDTKRKKEIWVIDVDLLPADGPPTLPPIKQDITGLAPANKRAGLPATAGITHQPQLAQPGQGAAGVMTPIGADTAASLCGAIHERARTVDEFFAYCRANHLDQLVVGKIPPEWPAAILPAARAFVASYPKVNAPASPQRLAAYKAQWAPPPAPPAAPASPPQTEVVNRQTGEVITPAAPAAAAPGPFAANQAAAVGGGIPDDEIPF